MQSQNLYLLMAIYIISSIIISVPHISSFVKLSNSIFAVMNKWLIADEVNLNINKTDVRDLDCDLLGCDTMQS
jgi:hypothetical protein